MKFTIENETLTKVLKILGLDTEEIKTQLKFPQPSIHDSTQEFKILILVRGLVDKFSSKPRKSQKPLVRSKTSEQLQSHLQLESSFAFSSTFQDLEKSFQGNQFLVSLYEISQKEQIYLPISDSIILFTFAEPVRLWTNTHGLVQSHSFSKSDLKTELLSFKHTQVNDFPCFVLRCEHYTANKILYQTYFYRFEEIDELLFRIYEISYLKTPVVVSAFVKFKGNLPCKTRAVFSGSGTKAYFVGAKEKVKTKEKGKNCWVTKLIPFRLIESLQFSNQELEFFENGFKCKVGFPVRSKSIYFEKPIFELEYIKFAQKIIELLRSVAKTAIKMPNFHKHKEKLSLFSEYLSTKISKMQNFSQNFSRNSNSENIIKKQTASQCIKLSENPCTIYQISNSAKISSYVSVYSEVLKLIKSQIPNTLQISSCLIDFIDSNEGLFLIKLLKLSFEKKSLVKLPVISSTKHISLFSATEGSGFVKGKMNKQRLCCGDYCSLLKRNDFETKEKIEFLMKHYLEYAGTLFELLKLQDLLNIDTVSHLLDRQKRPITPITQHMQYKVLRKVILEDRYDKYSLRSLILNLPSELVRDLNLILQSGSESTIELHIKESRSTGTVNGKKLTWEFELVPVCDKCYKIYSKRIKG